LKTDTELPV